MKAWRLHGPGRLVFEEVDHPQPKPGGVVVRMEAAPVLSYMKQVIDGSLGYALPAFPFVPGTNGVGIVEAAGVGVYHLEPGDRVSLNPHYVVDERVASPAQVLIGLTAMGASRFDDMPPEPLALQRDWPDGVFAGFASVPAACATPLAGLDGMPGERLAAMGKFVVPYGGFLRGGFRPGDVAIVNGASGYFGSAGVLLALAMGAALVVAAGRDRAALDGVAKAGGPRVRIVALSGDTAVDTRALREASDGAAGFALDIVGRAQSAASTTATLAALRRGGCLVLMGSVSQPLSISVGAMLANDWTVIGNFMYPKDAPARLARMISSGLLNLDAITVRRFALAELPAAMDAATRMRALDLTVVTMA
ncbi:MAG TPA: zinc-binding alcohol dehydrogenase family protein [Burkholderiales bacterium]|nr:zinc-binding alcohol dehydrogenase family protein [Burkholderiales bacterium]